MPIESIKVKKTGFHALQVIDSVSSHDSKDEKKTVSSGCHLSSTSQAEPPTKTTESHFALPPSQLVCTFTDGGVGLYNLGRRKWTFLRDQVSSKTQTYSEIASLTTLMPADSLKLCFAVLVIYI